MSPPRTAERQQASEEDFSLRNRESQRKEDQPMRYNKPEIVDSRNALEAIQGVQKGTPLPPDSMKINRTPSAYEADE
jgi:hypothetical protein